jgi:acyl-CoA thioester hydrolase
MHAETPFSTAPARGVIDGDTHRYPLRVYYEDTDAGGIVYYANYLKFAERARTEMMHLLGAGYAESISSGEIAFAVRRCEVDYLAPARLGDILEVHTTMAQTRGASMNGHQVVYRSDEELVRLEVELVCLNRDGRPARIPDNLRNVLQSLTSPST